MIAHMKRVLIVSIILLVVSMGSGADYVEACTPVVYQGAECCVLTAQSMDWKEDCQSNMRICPRGVDSLAHQTIHHIDSVVVAAMRSPSDLRLDPMTVSVVDRTQIERRGRVSLLALLAEQVPGLFVTSRAAAGYGVSSGAAGGMTLRGVGGGRQGGPTTGLLVLIDGVPQYMGLMGHPIADVCGSMEAERVEVVSGPASVLYGSNAMGGAVNIITRRMNEDGLRTSIRLGYGSFNTLQAEAASRMKSGRFTGMASVSYHRSDNHRPNMEFEQWGALIKSGCRLSDRWSVEADMSITGFDASNPGSLTAPVIDNDSRIVRGSVMAALRNEYPKSSGLVSLFCNFGRHHINDGYRQGDRPLDYRFNSRDRTQGVSVYQNFSPIQGSRLTVGLDYRQMGGRAWNRQLIDDSEQIIADKWEHQTACYVDASQRLGNLVTLSAGVRCDSHSHAGTEWIPQVGARLRLSDNTELRATAGKGFRFPTIREMYMFPSQNPDLKSERLTSCELSIRQLLLDRALSYRVTIYRICGYNMIITVPVDSRPMNVNSGRLCNWGVECDAVYRAGDRLVLTANYCYLAMKYPVVAAPEHKLYFGADYVWGRWSASIGVQHLRGLYTLLDPPERSRFTLLDAGVGFRLTRIIDLHLRGANLLSQEYQINAGYPMPKTTVSGGINLNF